MATSMANREVRSAEAVLSDWDGHIAILDESALASLCNGSRRPSSRRVSSSPKMCNGKLSKSHESLNTPERAQSEDDMSVNSDGPDEAILRRARNRALCKASASLRSVISTRTDNATAGSGALSRLHSVDIISRPPSSRLGSFYQQTTAGSSMLADSITEIFSDDYPAEHEPTSAILDYCKRKFLRPYMVILSLVGLNPVSTDTTKWCSFLGFLQCLVLVVVLIFGYFLQYLACYRGDRGFSANLKSLHLTAANASLTETTESVSTHTIGELLFGYIIPFCLDMAGYASAIVCCKLIDQEQLQNLIERTFLMSMQPRRLCRVLWLHVTVAFVLFACLYAYVVPVVLMQAPIVRIKWLAEMESELRLPVKICLLLTIAVQDIIEVIVLSSYCIECYLLKIHLLTLSQKLLLHSIDSLDWMREVLEFRKLLDRLNNHVSIPVSFFIVLNLAYASSGFVFMFKDFDFHYSALKLVILNFTNVILWLILGLLPFFMSASLTQACQSVKANGHQIRVRPFVYHNTSTDDLNSMLMFASSLDMSAKLFRMPIQSNYLCFAILVISIVVLTMGMCFNLTALGIF